MVELAGNGDGVAVGLGLGHRFARDIAGRARLVQDDNRFAQNLAELGAEIAHRDVGAGAGRKWTDRGDLLDRVALGMCWRR
jgi:hypothetical protein